MKNKKGLSHGMQLFLKSMLFTAAGILLLIIGYISAQYFFMLF